MSLCCKDMDRISVLPDELLIKVLAFLPTKDAVSTSVLSKRWECLWMWLPKLKFSCRRDSVSEWKNLQRFLDRNLPLHRAPVIESFSLKLCYDGVKPGAIKLWVVMALYRHLRKLKITTEYYNTKPATLLSSLYTCKSLVTLKLSGSIILDVPRRACLPSLKTLHLKLRDYCNGESLHRLLSICPVLEDLSAYFDDRERNMMESLTINVPSLLSLSLHVPGYYYGLFDKLVIDTSSLKYLKLVDVYGHRHSYLIENMPNLEDACVQVRGNSALLIRSITSVKRLTICSEGVYDDGLVFNKLEHLKLCVCNEIYSNLLVRLLNDSPNLRVVDIFVFDENKRIYYEPVRSVLECILASLQTYDWSGRAQDVAVYIFKKRWSLMSKSCDFMLPEHHQPHDQVVTD